MIEFKDILDFSSYIRRLDTEHSLQIQVSFSDLDRLASCIAIFFQPGDWIFLKGELGTGKTTFVSTIASVLGATQSTSSPTFSILNCETLEPGRRTFISPLTKLIHLDLYRLRSGKELCFLGLEEQFIPEKSLCFIEWPDRVSKQDFSLFFSHTGCAYPKRMLEVSFEHLKCYDSRLYTFRKRSSIDRIF